MRRRRSQLQVSLFPFLAVLLCTLGALILLLLVLDQKARQSAAAEAALQTAVAARQAVELAQRLDDLHAQRDQLNLQAQNLRGEQMTNAELLERQQAELAALRQRLQTENEQAARLEQAVAERRTQAAQTADQQAAAAAALTRLQAQIQLMEQTVRQLQEAARRRQAQPRYSLVPYKGKQGTQRRPLYLECRAGQVIFRPDGGSLSSGAIAAGTTLRTEIEQRFARLPQPGNTAKPYVLLLIRPSGIPLYYAILRTLQDSGIDVGYEFLDEEWALDFAEPDAGGAAHRETASAKPVGSAGKLLSGGRTATDRPAVTGANNPGGSRESQLPGALSPPPVLMPPSGDSPRLFAARPLGPGPSGLMPVPASSGNADRPLGERPASLLRPDGGNDREGPISPGGAVFIPPQSPGAKASSSPPERPTASGEPAKDRSQELNPWRAAAATSPEAASATERSPGRTQVGNPAGAEAQRTEPHDEDREADRMPAMPQLPPASGGGAGEPGTATGKAKGVRSLSRSTGPREWTITLECSGTTVTLFPQKTQFDLAALVGTENALLQTVTDVIEQKKKKSPEVLPQLKYLIRTDGLRAYYRAAAALQALHVPATHEILSDGAAVEPAPGGRP